MRILVIRLSSIGDIILTEPVIRHFRKLYPGCRIDYITKHSFVSLLEFIDGIHTIIPFTTHSKTVKKVRKSLSEDKRHSYDLIVDLHAKPKTFLLKYSLPAKRRVTYNKHHLLRLMIIKKICRKSIDSTVKSYLEVFRKLQLELTEQDNSPTIDVSFEQNNLWNSLTSEFDEKPQGLVAIFPGANHRTKRYPIELFAEFINKFTKDKRFTFVLLGSVEDKTIAERLMNLCKKKPHNWCGRFDLAQLVEVVSFFDVIITNDSGPLHIAAALKKKQIAIFGATHTCLGFRPLNDNAVILQTDIPCRPCSLHGGEKCPRKHFRCMNNITPERIQNALLTFFDAETQFR